MANDEQQTTIFHDLGEINVINLWLPITVLFSYQLLQLPCFFCVRRHVSLRARLHHDIATLFSGSVFQNFKKCVKWRHCEELKSFIFALVAKETIVFFPLEKKKTFLSSVARGKIDNKGVWTRETRFTSYTPVSPVRHNCSQKEEHSGSLSAKVSNARFCFPC